MVKHVLKIWPRFFNAMLDGKKKFEYRKNDRDFQPNDILKLREYVPQGPTTGYTGRFLNCEIESVWEGIPGLPKGFCIMSIKTLDGGFNKLENKGESKND